MKNEKGREMIETTGSKQPLKEMYKTQILLNLYSEVK